MCTYHTHRLVKMAMFPDVHPPSNTDCHSLIDTMDEYILCRFDCHDFARRPWPFPAKAKIALQKHILLMKMMNARLCALIKVYKPLIDPSPWCKLADDHELEKLTKLREEIQRFNTWEMRDILKILRKLRQNAADATDAPTVIDFREWQDHCSVIDFREWQDHVIDFREWRDHFSSDDVKRKVKGLLDSDALTLSLTGRWSQAVRLVLKEVTDLSAGRFSNVIQPEGCPLSKECIREWTLQEAWNIWDLYCELNVQLATQLKLMHEVGLSTDRSTDRSTDIPM